MDTRDSIYQGLHRELGANIEGVGRLQDGLLETWRTIDGLSQYLGPKRACEIVLVGSALSEQTPIRDLLGAINDLLGKEGKSGE